MSRRGLLRGEWFRLIRQRGVDLIAQESNPQFQIKSPSGQAKRGSGFPHRPPHAVPESEFVAGCTKCDACIQACPPHAIFRAPQSEGMLAEFPIIDAETQPCIMCEDLPCVPACEAGVLRFDAPVSMALAVIHPETCLAFLGKVCTECVDQCPVTDAMTMEAGKPVINGEACTGCGVCLYVCPAQPNTIELLPIP